LTPVPISHRSPALSWSSSVFPPFGTRRVQYADGTVVSKPVALAEILIDQEVTPAVVLYEGPTDLILIGATTLKNLNLGVDPLRKTLIPLIPPQV
jgi:predicted aspartyl protease